MQRFLMISGHDYRTPRRVNVHFIAEELAKRGETRFLSIGFSVVSHLRADPRRQIAERANRIETYRGVDCFLWKSAWHPFNLHRPALRGLSRLMFEMYRSSAPDVFKRWAADSDVVILESGMSPIFVEMIRALNPGAKLIYLVSDLLDTVGVDRFVSEELTRMIGCIDEIVVPSALMARDFPGCSKLRVIPHGLDISPAQGDPSPYAGGINAVSVGPMLFDRGFFKIAAPACPQVSFHIIGGGSQAKGLGFPNVRTYDEMPYLETLRYIKHARFGIAPYLADRVADYLCDTSMKLAQYEFFRIPAVCPQVAVGEHKGRFGYRPGDRASIESAILNALSSGRIDPPAIPSWSQVTDRILSPHNDAGTALPRARAG
jgi:2-beta-glucuronyltransferase